MASGSDRLISPSAGFDDSAIGRTFCVPGALGGTINPLVSTCIAVISAQEVKLSSSSSAPVSSGPCVYGTNNTEAINKALADPFVRTRGYLLFPAGMFLVGGATLDVLSNMEVVGRGRATVIYAADYADSAFYAQSKAKIAFRSLTFRSHAVERSTLSTTAALWIRECSDVDVEDIYIDGSASAGVFVDLCGSVHVKTVEVRNTKADGVHIVGCTEAIVEGVRGYRTGDDTVSVVSYASQAQARKVVISDVISEESRTRAVTVGGSANVLVTQVLAISPGAHGVIIVYESGGANPAAELHTPKKVTLSYCRIENARGALGPPEGFNSLLIAGDATHMVDDVLVQGCTILNSNQAKITFAKNVRLLGNEIRDSRFNGLIVEDSQDVDVIDNKLKNIEGIGISYVRVTDGQVSRNRLTECQTLNEFGLGASQGRLHFIDCFNVFGFANRDQRSATVASFGAILVSGGARVAVGVTEIDTDAVDVNKRIKGMEVASLRDAGVYKDQLLLGTNIPVNVDRYAIVADRGLFVEEGDIHIDGIGSFLGSGGAAYLNLSSGFAQLAATSSARIWINRTDADTNNTFFVTTGSGDVLILALSTGGQLFIEGGLHPGGTSSGVGYYAYDGNPNGNVSAPVGSYCARNWSTLAASGSDAPIYHKDSGGSGPTGWVPVNLASEIPNIAGNARKALRVNDAGTGYGWFLVPLDDPGAISLSSVGSARYLYKASSGGDQIIGKGPADVWDEIKSIAIADLKTALAHEHDYLDNDGSSDNSRTTGGANW